MKTICKEIGKWVLFAILLTVGAIAFMVFCGESDEMPLGQFFLWKLAAGFVLYICYLIAKKLYAEDLLPERVKKDIEEDEV